VALLVFFYIVVGRDLVALVRAKRGQTATEVRYEVQKVKKDVETVAGAVRGGAASELDSPLALTSAAALAGREDQGDVDAWLSE
jgi:hypothetical protein